MNSDLARLYDHLEWADKAMLAALGQAESHDEKAHKLIAHIISAEHIWLTRIQSQPIGQTTAWDNLTLPECQALSAQIISDYRTLIESTSEQHLNELVTYRNLQGIEFQTPLRDILLHVALHGAYHRGQIAASLRNSGLEPPSTDFILFSRHNNS
ncbi:DinB family protein [Geothrix oryzae]|uniref:DinB family protein n=1 Tax=Geothrix oryzae TaxID=2927975 RepID=UPI0035CA4024